MHTDAADRRRHRLAPDRRALRPAARATRPRRSSRSTAPSPSPRSRARQRRSTRSSALDLDGYHLYHATRADLLARLGRAAEAAAAYDAAIRLTANAAERRLLEGSATRSAESPVAQARPTPSAGPRAGRSDKDEPHAREEEPAAAPARAIEQQHRAVGVDVSVDARRLAVVDGRRDDGSRAAPVPARPACDAELRRRPRRRTRAERCRA